MYVRRLEVDHYRGIEHLECRIPKGHKLICMIGPGDSGKSTLLDALHLVLGDRWNPSIADTDFYKCDVTVAIKIRCVVSDLPKSLLKESSLGLWLSGIDDAGELHQDPADGLDSALIIQLSVDETLEPVWTVERLDGSDSMDIRASHRREFATFKIDDRIDTHLRWTRTSALGRISASDNSTGNAMALAARAAREAIAGIDDEKLKDLTERVQGKLNEVGSGSFESVRAGLDTSLSAVGGNLALYEENVPLTNYGLGSRRLAGLAVQQLAAAGKSVLLIDEVEHGLEPHRLVRLLQYLNSDQGYSQVFVTTHSPVAVEQVSTDNLAILRNDHGKASMSFLPEDSGTTLKLRRSRPSSFLGRRVVVCEGRTEEGMTLAIMQRSDAVRLKSGESVAAGEGSVAQDGEGGSCAPARAIALLELGYEVALFLDNDDASVDDAVADASSKGAEIVRWETGNCTERQLVMGLDSDGLSAFLQLAKVVRQDDATVVNDLRASGLPCDLDTLEVSEWLADAVETLDAAREIVAKTAVSSKWFKSLDGGMELGCWVWDHLDDFDSAVRETVTRLHDFIYPSALSASVSAHDE